MPPPPKRQRFPPPPPRVPFPVPQEEEEENDDSSDNSVDDEDDFSDVSADGDEGEDEEDDDDVEVVEAPPRRSVRSSSPSSSSSVKLKSTDLDCPTCYEPLTGPIYQCRNGHLTCCTCLPRVHKQCPVCRISIGDMRCRAMEKLIESTIVPCCNAVYGCEETSPYGYEWEHEKECVHIRCMCPYPECNYTGGYKDVENHARASHSWDVENLTPFVFDCPQIFSMNLARKKTAVFQEEREGDLIVVQAFRGEQGVRVTVSRIAPLFPGVRNLSCSLAKLNAYTTLRLGVKVKRIQNVEEEEEPPEEDFLFIPDYMLSADHLKMQICVGNELKYCHI